MITSTAVTIANMALNKVGGKRITALTESNAINDCYDYLLDEVLMEHQWSFAQKRAALGSTTAPSIGTEDGLTTCFSAPADLIKVNYTNSRLAVVKLESTGILCNLTSLSIIYTFRNTTPTTYSSSFITAFAARIAAEIAFSYTESATKARELYDLYEKVQLPKAISLDSAQGTPEEITQDEWELARKGGSTSSDYWIPVITV